VPWENGYQESFYDKFKVDLEIRTALRRWGSSCEIYRTVWGYNNTRIHSAAQHAACSNSPNCMRPSH